MASTRRIAHVLALVAAALCSTAVHSMPQLGTPSGCHGVVVQSGPGQPFQLRCTTPCTPPKSCYRITSTITLPDGTHTIRVCNCLETDDNCCKIGIVDVGTPGAYPLATGRCHDSSPPDTNCPSGNGCYADEPDTSEPAPWVWDAYCSWYFP